MIRRFLSLVLPLLLLLLVLVGCDSCSAESMPAPAVAELAQCAAPPPELVRELPSFLRAFGGADTAGRVALLEDYAKRYAPGVVQCALMALLVQEAASGTLDENARELASQLRARASP